MIFIICVEVRRFRKDLTALAITHSLNLNFGRKVLPKVVHSSRLKAFVKTLRRVEGIKDQQAGVVRNLKQVVRNSMVGHMGYSRSSWGQGFVSD